MRFKSKMGEPFFRTQAARESRVNNLSTFLRRMSMKRPKWLRLVQRRSVWWPTWLGAFCITVLLVSPLAWWYLWGESFLSATCRLPAEILVVEGWIGEEGVSAAAAEFRQHDYRYVVAAGCVTDDRWQPDHWSYADVAERELIRLGIPPDRIIVAPAGDVKSRRTYQSAVATCRALRVKGIQLKGVNVFTLGPHAARSRLVFAKVFGSETEVGVIDWTPADYESGPWWRSSARAKELISETAGYLFELVLNSGRSPNLSKTSTGVSQPQAGWVSGDPHRSCRVEIFSRSRAGFGIPARVQRNILDTSRDQPLRHQATRKDQPEMSVSSVAINARANTTRGMRVAGEPLTRLNPDKIHG
jgi:DUF218 domain